MHGHAGGNPVCPRGSHPKGAASLFQQLVVLCLSCSTGLFKSLRDHFARHAVHVRFLLLSVPVPFFPQSFRAAAAALPTGVFSSCLRFHV